MSDMTLKCPKCGAEIPLTEGIAAPMVAAVRTEMQTRIDIAISQAEEVERKAKAKEDHLEEELQTRMKAQVQLAEVSAKEKARLETAADFACEQKIAVQAQQEAEALRVKLAEAQKAQAEALRKERELADRERELELTVERRIGEGVGAARDAARRDADEAARLRLAEKDMILQSLQTKITDLQQKIDSGSQQAQGEVLEVDVEAQLRSWFPRDEFAEIGKGIRGADVTHHVLSPSGAQCGVVIYEVKRTKTFSAGWLAKLRADGREAHADAFVLVTQAMPDDVKQFGLVDGVWVCCVDVLRPLVDALRIGLLGAQIVRQAAAGEASQSEIVYRYLTGPRFKARIEATVEAWSVMQTDLEAERRAVTRAWAKRAAQIDAVMNSTSGLFGDIQGLGGAAIPEIEGLSMKALGVGNEV
jgi:hypothetical protein